MKDDQNSINQSQGHRAIPRTESQAASKLKAAPSPRPWQWLPNEGQFVVDARGNLVGEIPCQGCNPLDGELIVHAVNAHDALVAAAQAAQYALQQYEHYDTEMSLEGRGLYNSDPRFIHATLHISNALALAESGGKEPEEDERSPIPCSKCGEPTTFDPTYGDLCFRCCRAENE